MPWGVLSCPGDGSDKQQFVSHVWTLRMVIFAPLSTKNLTGLPFMSLLTYKPSVSVPEASVLLKGTLALVAIGLSVSGPWTRQGLVYRTFLYLLRSWSPWWGTQLIPNAFWTVTTDELQLTTVPALWGRGEDHVLCQLRRGCPTNFLVGFPALGPLL